MSKTISQNTTYLTLASVLQKVLAFVYFTVLANIIGVEGTGKYFFALSFTTIFVVFIDLGFTNVFVREAAKAKEKIGDYLSTLIVFKAGLAMLTYIAAVVTIHVLGYPPETRLLVYVSGVTMIFDTFHLTLYGALRAFGDLRYEGIGMAGSQLVTLIIGSICLWFELPLVSLILAFTIASALNLLFATSVLVRRYHMVPRWHFDPAIFRYLGGIAIPFAIAAIFARLYSYADTMILSRLLGDVAVGIYSIPYKITYAFQFIPLALVAAMYPKMSELFATNRERLSFVFERGLVYLLLIATPIAIGIFVLSKEIIDLLYADTYVASVAPLQILILSLLFSFVSFPIGSLLNACDRQRAQTTIVGIALVVNIAINLLLIPIIGVSGAAIAALVGNSLLTICGYAVATQITRLDHWYLVSMTLRILCSGVVMGVAVALMVRSQHLFAAIITGAIVYPLCLYLTRTVTVAQLREMKAMIRS